MFGDFSALAKAGDDLSKNFAQLVDLLTQLNEKQDETNQLLRQIAEKQNGP